MDILQGAIGLLGQLVDVAGRWIALLLQPQVLSVVVGVVIAIGTAQGLKRAPFMLRRQSAETRRARTWYLRAFAFLAGAVFTALMWPGDIATRAGVGAAAGLSAPLVYDVLRFVAAKFGVAK